MIHDQRSKLLERLSVARCQRLAGRRASSTGTASSACRRCWRARSPPSPRTSCSGPAMDGAVVQLTVAVASS
eukprot:11889943-Alexandrium_andersonii.AAC.1